MKDTLWLHQSGFGDHVLYVIKENKAPPFIQSERLLYRWKTSELSSNFIECWQIIIIFLYLAQVNEERGCNPQHLIHLGLRYAEARIDYMGTCILMGNLSAFKTDLRDEWTLQETKSPSTGE